MLTWIIIIGVLMGGTVICVFEGMITGDSELLTGAIFLEIIFLSLFLILLKRYRSPEYKEKQRERAEWMEKEPERRAAMEEVKRIQREKQQEAERKRTTIVATRLIGEGSAEYKKSVGSMMVRGAVGGFFAGAAGATLGMATAKNKNTNKNVRRFLVKYLDGHIEEKEATVGSSQYKEYMKYLEWEE